MPSQKIDATAIVSSKAIIHEEVTIGPYSIIGEDVEIASGTVVGPHTMIQGPTKIGSGCTFTGYASIGTPPQDLKYKGEKTILEMGDNNLVREFVTINRGTGHGGGITRVGSNNLLMTNVHIAHDCQVGDNVVMSNLATLAGHVHIGDNAIIGGMSVFHQFTKIGAYCFIGGGSGVTMDVIPYAKAAGKRVMIMGPNVIGLKRKGFTDKEIDAINDSYRILFRKKLMLIDALKVLEEKYGDEPVVIRIIDFIKTSTRGITR